MSLVVSIIQVPDTSTLTQLNPGLGLGGHQLCIVNFYLNLNPAQPRVAVQASGNVSTFFNSTLTQLNPGLGLGGKVEHLDRNQAMQCSLYVQLAQRSTSDD